MQQLSLSDSAFAFVSIFGCWEVPTGNIVDNVIRIHEYEHQGEKNQLNENQQFTASMFPLCSLNVWLRRKNYSVLQLFPGNICNASTMKSGLFPFFYTPSHLFDSIFNIFGMFRTRIQCERENICWWTEVVIFFGFLPLWKCFFSLSLITFFFEKRAGSCLNFCSRQKSSVCMCFKCLLISSLSMCETSGKSFFTAFTECESFANGVDGDDR